MKYLLSSLFSINIVLSLAAGIFGSIWVNNDIETSQIAFYLSISFTSMFVGCVYLIIKNKCSVNRNIDTSRYLNFIACLSSFIITILWIAVSICISLITKDCLNINTLNDICTGATVNIILSVLSLLVWFSILWISLYRLLNMYRRFPALEAQACDEIY